MHGLRPIIPLRILLLLEVRYGEWLQLRLLCEFSDANLRQVPHKLRNV